MRPATVPAIAVMFILLLSVPVGAITYGVPDAAGRHPNVGFMGVKYRGYDPIFLWCSGTLIAPNVFLTASHCTIDLEYGLAAGFIEAGYVGFDRVYSSRLSDLRLAFEVERAVTNPDYTFTHRSDDGDVAVLLLKEDVTLRAPQIQPARLPTAGLLDDLAAKGGLHGEKFPAVGYGDRLVDRGHGQPTTYGFGERYIGVQEYRGLGPGYLHVSQNPSTGDGGTCYGDSGGPNFLGDSDIIVALTVYGDTWCRASSRAYRLDTESARSFLGDYVTLP